eukprot:9950107-Lingulodinium_polyedra.AAC.1
MAMAAGLLGGMPGIASFSRPTRAITQRQRPPSFGPSHWGSFCSPRTARDALGLWPRARPP